jgi:3-oxoacyl-[acyl-carrier protein] reductase
VTVSVERDQRRVLVTGASKGIGRAIALRLAADGYSVTAHFGGDREGASETQSMIEAQGGVCGIVGFDVRDTAQARGALDADMAANGPYWGVVSNAGIARDNAFPAIEEQDWKDVVSTSLDGFYNCVHPLVMPMVRAKAGGRVVVISSVSGVMGNRGQVNYSAAKAGLIGAAKALAVELASRNITVNCVAPGLIETAMTAQAPVEEALKIIPMKRIGAPEDVAGVVSFLFSDDAAYVTRQVIGVNGGIV